MGEGNASATQRNDATSATIGHKDNSTSHSAVDDLARTVGMTEKAPETMAKMPVASPSPSTVGASSDSSKRKRSDSEIDTTDAETADEFTREFSRAQVKAKVKRARLEANLAVQDEIKELRFALLKAQQEVADRDREREREEKRYAMLRARVDEIVKQHQRTLNGMRDNIDMENLVASLEKEKSTKEALRESLQKQNGEILQAQKRIDDLTMQITKYQKTETVLAQSISHFQHQSTSKDHERVAMIEQIKASLEQQHQEERVALEDEVRRLTLVKEAQQQQFSELQIEHAKLKATAQTVLEKQERHQGEESELQSRVSQLETEKAVLSSKVDQVQKADVQLRNRIATLEADLVARDEEIESHKREIDELSKIATDLMDMAEAQQAEKQELLQQSDPEANERLERNRTRLRESLG